MAVLLVDYYAIFCDECDCQGPVRASRASATRAARKAHWQVVRADSGLDRYPRDLCPPCQRVLAVSS